MHLGEREAESGNAGKCGLGMDIRTSRIGSLIRLSLTSAPNPGYVYPSLSSPRYANIPAPWHTRTPNHYLDAE